MRNKTCPCEFTDACSKNCSCANPFLSGGCSRCCKYGSEEQRKAAALSIAERERKFETISEKLKIIDRYMESILLVGGNQTDAYWSTKGGPNDSRLRGDMYVSCREIARASSKILKDCIEEIK
jgi:hypothetical protein